jgi:photosystem II stability/assembly factor-like uncharacterized protein
MNRFIFTLMTLLILIAKLQGQWEIINEGVAGSFNTIDFVDKNTGWLGGLQGKILKTEDGGETWHALPFDQGLSIAQFDFSNNNIGWAVANRYDNDLENGIILKTADGGKSWSLQKKVGNWHFLNSIYAVNDSVVYAVGDSIVLKTSDGGLSWIDISSQLPKASYRSIYFLNNETGIVTSEFYDSMDGRWYAYIMRTSDGGATWHRWTLPNVQSLHDLQFVNDTTGYFVCQNDSESVLYETKDFCKSWTLKFKSPFRISTLMFTNASTAYAVQRDSSYFQNFMQSTDGGMTWEKKSAISLIGNYKVYILNDRVGFLFGSYRGGGILHRSIDQGNNWKVQKLSCSFDRVFFIDKDTGFAAGGKLPGTHFTGWGYLFKTNDGCKTWDFSLEPEAMPTCLFFTDRNVGFMIIPNLVWCCYALGPPSVYKTNDGGNNWSCTWSCDIDSLYNFKANDAWFLNEQSGWIVGRQSYWNAAIFETSDGGETWKTAWQHPDTSQHCTALHSLYFVNDNSGWAVGENGCMVKYTQETGWQNKPPLTDLPLNCVFFTDENNGWIAGGYVNENDFRRIFVKTQDGGGTWQKITLLFLVHDIYFQDSQHGWVIGTNRAYNGVILETTDGGDHWEMVDNSFRGLISFHHCDNYLWAAGDNGLILRTTIDKSVGLDEQKNKSYPESSQLFQNYPNPFNANTAISYQLSAVSDVELSIYNLVGQKVVTLISKKQPAGNYRVEWDASDFSSGVYFLRLVTDKGFTNTKKLVVLK